MKIAPTRLSGSTGRATARCWGWLSRCTGAVATSAETIGRAAGSAGLVHDVNNVARPTPEQSSTVDMRIWCPSCLTMGRRAELNPPGRSAPASVFR
nr:hypothetical protein [Mycobacterium interjectum]